MAATETAILDGDNAPTEEVDSEGAAPSELSDAELDAALGEPSESDHETETTEQPAEEGEPEDTVTKETKSPLPTPEEYAALKKKVENQELFIQRQGTEVGQLRKLREGLEKIAAEKRALVQEQLLTDPAKALDTHAEAREAEAQVKQAQANEQLEANREAIQAAFPDYDNRIDDIVAAAREMGTPDEYLENFRRNPYATPISILVPYVRAANLRKFYFEKAQLVDKLTTQLNELNKSQGSFTKKLKEVASSAPVITSKGGSHTSGKLGSIDESQITELSYAEIERLLATK